MSIRSYQYSFGAGDVKQYIGGGFFTIEQVTNEVTLTIKDPRGNEIGVVENVGAGFWINLDDKEIGSIDIYSASAQTINVIIGSGEFGVNKTSTTITGGVLDPHTIKTLYSGNSTTSPVAIVTPAANIAGVRVDSIVSRRFATAGNGAICIDTVTPANYYTGKFSLYTLKFLSSTGLVIDKSAFPVVVPAGHGIYIGSDVAAVIEASVAYEILT